MKFYIFLYCEQKEKARKNIHTQNEKKHAFKKRQKNKQVIKKNCADKINKRML